MPTWKMTVIVPLAALAACGRDQIPEPPAGFAHATATRDCGPADGPAVSIFLANQPAELEPEPPYIRIYLTRGVDEVSGQTWQLSGDGAQGSAQYCPAGGGCEAATGGTISVSAVAADTTLDAAADLVFPTHGHVTGGIHARWVSRLMMCG
jgi:hypothetical protein